MNQEIVDFIDQVKRQATISYDQRLRICNYYTQVYGNEKSGCLTCGECLKDAFWKLLEEVQKFKNAPPVPVEPKPSRKKK